MGISEDFSVLDTSLGAQKLIAETITKIFSERFKPPPKLNLVEWADKFRFLPDNSAEPGRWKTKRVEVARQPMLSISDSNVKEVTIMSCIQLMKTELMINTALYYMHQDPSPMMYVAPKKEIAEAWSKERFNKSVSTTPVLKDIFASNRRGDGNTILQKQFPGGQISIVSARNPDDLAMRACRIMLFDECDKYPANVGAGEGGAGGEGDPIAVAWGRATTYGNRAKKIVACSPTVQGKSRIEQEYLASNQSVFYQPCPHCNHAKEIEWPDVIIPVDEETGEYLPEKAYVHCAECDAHWTEGDRHKSISKGYWVAKRPHIIHHHGYKVSSLASPFTPVKTLATEFVNAMGNAQLLKAFYNTRMARTWREEGEQPDWEVIYNRRESYKISTVPDGGLLLTMGMDVQKAGVYYEVVAWGARKQSWSVEAAYLQGDINEENFREEVKKVFDRTYKNTVGVEMPIEKICLDTGYNTQSLYSLVRDYGDQRLVAIKGDQEGRLSNILGTPTPVDVNHDGKRISRGLMLWHVGASVLKEQFYNWLNLKKPTDEKLKAGVLYPSGFCHFPEYDEEYFKQITAEQRVRTENKKGFEVWAWERTRKDNHFLDCRSYARAAATMLQMERMTDEAWEERQRIYSVKVDSKPVTDDTSVYKDNTGRARRKSSWLKKG